MNQVEYAAHRGVTQQLIAKYIRNGKLDGAFTKHGRSYLIDPVAADTILNGDTSETTRRNEKKQLRLTDERARLAKERADAQEIKNQVARGELLPASELRAGLIKHIIAARNRLTSIPNKVGQQVIDYLGRQETAEVVEIIEREIADALNDLAGFKP